MSPNKLSAFLIASLLLIWEPAWAQAPASTSPSQQTYTVKIDFNVRVKMRDGVELSADVYRPDTAGQFPVILSRTPYNKNGAVNQGRYFASHGYVYVAMDVRGRGDSDGKFIRTKTMASMDTMQSSGVLNSHGRQARLGRSEARILDVSSGSLQSSSLRI